MDETQQHEDLVRRLAAAARGASLYSPKHPLVQRSIEELVAVCGRVLQGSGQIVIGFLGSEIVVNNARLPRSSAALNSFARYLIEREIEKVTIRKGVKSDEFRALILELAAKSGTASLEQRFSRHNIRHISIGQIVPDNTTATLGIAAARKLYQTAVGTAETLWAAAKAGDKPDPSAARSLIQSLSKLVHTDQTSVLSLTALKKYDNYTFTHMVNVSILTMAQARSLNLAPSLVREFGVAALMHDIGKVNTPLEILNKPDTLTREEFAVMKRHVIDGAHILRVTPEMPNLATIVAFEHHLRVDLTGYPENVTPRKLNLCTLVVSIADVYDALRCTRTYREGLPSERVRAIMNQQAGTAFNNTLLRRFVNLVGLFPVATFVRLNTDEIGVVTHEHPGDPFRPQVKLVLDARGQRFEQPILANTWQRDAHGEYPRAIVEAVDGAALGLDPLALL